MIEQVGHIHFETEAANLFFQLVSSRYEHTSLILTSKLPFSGWGEVFGNRVSTSGAIDRIVHHAEFIPLNGREQGTIMKLNVNHFSMIVNNRHVQLSFVHLQKCM
jgi:DNA replication protein DnaC